MSAKYSKRFPEIDFEWRAIGAIDGDLHLGWKRATEDLPDVFWSPHYGGHWILLRAEHMSRVYLDNDHFSSSDVTVPPMSSVAEKTFKILPAESDPPIHRDYRRLLAPAFNAPELKRLGDAAQTLATALVNGVKSSGNCDFVSAFAERYPVQVFLNMVELPPDDDAILRPLVGAIVHGKSEEERGAGFEGMIAYVRGQLELRQDTDRNDIFSKVARGVVDGRPIAANEALGICCNLLFAGLDTVVAASSFIMRFLATHPGHVGQLRDNPALIPQAVEELLRYHGLTNLGRRVVKDVEIGGILIPAGDMVVMPLTVHGLDERIYPDPLTIDFHRQGPPNMIFATGVHFCLGNRLARLELKILLETWLAAIPSFSVDPEGPFEAVSDSVNMIKSLPLIW